MTEKRYFVKVGSDGRLRFYVQEAEVKVISTKQATRADIKIALEDIRIKRGAYDKALLEYVK